MALINFYTKEDDASEYNLTVINHDGSSIGWILKNIPKGQNFSVYKDNLSKEHDISRDFDQINEAKEISVFLLPAGGLLIAGYIVAAILVVVALTAKPAALPNVNRTQQSPNNSLSDRNNRPRPNQRIVDVCGKVKCIPDVLSREYSRFVDDVEVRVGYYCVARNNLVIEDIKEGDTLLADIQGSSAGVYGANRSPNDDLPADIQIGDIIDEDVYGVTQSADAIGQTLVAPNANTLNLSSSTKAFRAGYLSEFDADFTDKFQLGDTVNLIDAYARKNDKPGEADINLTLLQGDSLEVIAIEPTKITFDITGKTGWDLIYEFNPFLIESRNPKIVEIASNLVGPFKMTSFKINRLLVNVNAINGMYKENTTGLSKASVDYVITYQKLDDNGQTIGEETPVPQTITGTNSSQKGLTTEIDLGGPTFIQWNVERITPLDFDFNGTIVDEIKVNSVFGLSNIDKEHFGNVTTIQTKRTSEFLTTATKTPELNCIATELVQKYEGGTFATEYTPNTQAMQSLIRLALDPYIGRRSAGELDLNLLASLQDECETYFVSNNAGQFNYSFDSTSLSAQETFMSIAKAAFITLWREGRVLKGWFESPQSVPTMVFTHRSKQPNAETWNRKRNTSDAKDSIEFVYTDDVTYSKETLFFPTDRSGTNPNRVELTGIKGKELAHWHMMRLFNKQKYQEVTVDFGATAEGRFVKPQSLISVVKGARVYTYDGYVVAVNGLQLTLSQNLVFTAGDDHSIILKKRDGSTESILVTATEFKNVVELSEPPTETIYTGNDALKTEFSFGNESRLDAQLMIAQEIAPSGDQYVKIKAINYSPLYYQNDSDVTGSSFNLGFDLGFS